MNYGDILNCEVVELRYSLNGISDSQLIVLFSQIESEQKQIIIKRLSNPLYALTSDDLILEGIFSSTFLENLSRAFPPPLSCKIQGPNLDIEKIRDYAAISWGVEQTIYGGISLLPILQIQQMTGFITPTQFINLISSTKAGSVLKSLLAIKPKGIMAVEENFANIVFPMHRVDFILAWINQLNINPISLDWLSGSTDELSEELVSTIGSIDQSEIGMMEQWLHQADNVIPRNFEVTHKRALIGLQKV